jgi:hypothetical protein
MATSKRNIQNPAKWIGKYVRHMANWEKYEWPLGCNDLSTTDYFVDFWSGKLYPVCDEHHWTQEEADLIGEDLIDLAIVCISNVTANQEMRKAQ